MLVIEGNDMVEGFGWLDYDNLVDFEEVVEWFLKCVLFCEFLLVCGLNVMGFFFKIENNFGMIEDDFFVMELISLNFDFIEFNNWIFGILLEINYFLKI